jgi:hypothetical protein
MTSNHAKRVRAFAVPALSSAFTPDIGQQKSPALGHV